MAPHSVMSPTDSHNGAVSIPLKFVNFSEGMDINTWLERFELLMAATGTDSSHNAMQLLLRVEDSAYDTLRANGISKKSEYGEIVKFLEGRYGKCTDTYLEQEKFRTRR